MSIASEIILGYWIRKLFVSDQTNDSESTKNVFGLPGSFIVTGYMLTILFSLLSIGFHILASSENENFFYYVSIIFALLSLLGIYTVLYSKFYTLYTDQIGLTERIFFSKTKKIAWRDIKLVKFNRFSANFVFIGYPYPKIKVSFGIKNFNVFLNIFTDKLKPDIYEKAIEDFRKYQKNLSL
ncbi:hypothetical protein AB3N59_11100 [Leptospira sp. WS92.C1]